jgi:hypothetical protein
MRTMLGGNAATGRGGPRAGWAAIAGIAIGAALLAGVDEPENAASAPGCLRPSVLLRQTVAGSGEVLAYERLARRCRQGAGDAAPLYP